jgi:hypothetical protein
MMRALPERRRFARSPRARCKLQREGRDQTTARFQIIQHRLRLGHEFKFLLIARIRPKPSALGTKITMK